MEAPSNYVKTKVVAYSGYKANERPIRFTLEGLRKDVKEVQSRWCEPDYDYFKVLAGDGCVYLLKWHRGSDTWYVEKG